VSRKAISTARKILPVFLVIIFIAVCFLTSYFPITKSHAVGTIQNTFLTQNCTNCQVTYPNNPTQGNYLVVYVVNSGSTSLPSGVPTDTLGNTFSSVVSDNAQIGVAFYIANQTHAAGSDTVTVPFGSAQTGVFITLAEVTQLSSLTPSVTSSGSLGSGTQPIAVGSVTPNKNDMCFGTSASVGSLGLAEPNTPDPMSVLAASATALSGTSLMVAWIGINPSTAANTFPFTELRGASATNTGSSLAPITKWDYVVGCFPSNYVTTSTTSVPTTTTTSTVFTNTTTSTLTSTITKNTTSTLTSSIIVTNTTTSTLTSTLTSVSLTTQTGVVIPEPQGTTDIILIITIIIVQLFFVLLAFIIKPKSDLAVFVVFLNLFGALMNVVMDSSVIQNPTVIWGQNSFLMPSFGFVFLAIIFFANIFAMLYILVRRH